MFGFKRVVYFELYNGDVVAPYSFCPPAYRVTVIFTGRFFITKLETCFSVANIARNGKDWANSLVHQDAQSWKNYKWLKKSLRKYLISRFWHILKDKDLGEVKDENYVYLEIPITKEINEND